MLKKMICTGVLGILFLGTAALATGIPDLGNSTVSWPYEGSETLSLFVVPDGSGHAFTEAFLPSTANGGPGVTTDATITLTLLDGGYFPIANFPFEDLWLQSADGGMVPCIGGTVADFNTDALGRTYWIYPLMAGGWSQALMQVVINGDALVGGDLPLSVNSPDIDGSGVVNLADVAYFSGAYHGAYQYRVDFNYDGALNLTDVGYMSAGVGAGCP